MGGGCCLSSSDEPLALGHHVPYGGILLTLQSLPAANPDLAVNASIIFLTPPLQVCADQLILHIIGALRDDGHHAFVLGSAGFRGRSRGASERFGLDIGHPRLLLITMNAVLAAAIMVLLEGIGRDQCSSRAAPSAARRRLRMQFQRIIAPH